MTEDVCQVTAHQLVAHKTKEACVLMKELGASGVLWLTCAVTAQRFEETYHFFKSRMNELNECKTHPEVPLHKNSKPGKGPEI